jgi:hypothetical protein
MFRQARFKLLKTLFNILISPFGEVKFKDFFLADVLTSLSIPLGDIQVFSCYFISSAWVDADKNECFSMPIPYYSIGVLPYWFRFA